MKHNTKPEISPAARTRGRPPLGESERKRILDATTAVFLERGYQRASTSEIARRARTSKQTLYSLFPTKADLFAAVITAQTERLFSRHIEFLESDAPPSSTLNEMGYVTLRMFSAPIFLSLYRILVAESQSFPDLSRRLWVACVERGQKLLAEYLKSWTLGGPDYRRSAEQFVSFVLGDFVLNATLNPDLKLSERALRSRVQAAVKDFLALHPEPWERKQG